MLKGFWETCSFVKSSTPPGFAMPFFLLFEFFSFLVFFFIIILILLLFESSLKSLFSSWSLPSSSLLFSSIDFGTASAFPETFVCQPLWLNTSLCSYSLSVILPPSQGPVSHQSAAFTSSCTIYSATSRKKQLLLVFLEWKPYFCFLFSITISFSIFQ